MENEYLLEELFEAYFDARRHKRNTHNQLRFEINYDRNLVELYHDICERRYETSPSVCFIVNRPVKREIFAADFRDRVVHHLLFNYLSPECEKQFIDDSYSCRKGRGTLYGIHRVEEFIRKCSNGYKSDCYILKLDIRGYFMSIDKKILYSKLVSLVTNAVEANGGQNPFSVEPELILYLIEKTIFDDPRTHCHVKGHKEDWDGLPLFKSLFYARENCGIPIGNLTSQLFSNIFLHSLDVFVKHTLGLPYYGRYVDDFVIVHADKQKLLDTVKAIRDFLASELNLVLHPHKVYIQHYTKGVSFLGAYIKPHRCYVSNRTARAFKKCNQSINYRLASGPEPSVAELMKIRASINSYIGIMIHFRSYNIRRKWLFEGENLIYRYGYLTNHLGCYVLKKEYTDIWRRFGIKIKAIEAPPKSATDTNKPPAFLSISS